MSGEVSTELADWVVSILPYHDANTIRSHGLDFLKVPELKQLEREIQRNPTAFENSPPARLNSSAKKSQRVAYIRQTFRGDSSRKRERGGGTSLVSPENPLALSSRMNGASNRRVQPDLSSNQQRPPPGQHAPSGFEALGYDNAYLGNFLQQQSSAYPAFNSATAMMFLNNMFPPSSSFSSAQPQMMNGYRQAQHTMSPYASSHSYTAASAPNSASAPVSGQHQSPPAAASSSRQDHASGQQQTRKSPSNNTHGSNANSSHKKKTPPKKKIKTEPIPPDQPQNVEEHRLLTELTQMGFPDKLEILTAIRRNPDGSTSEDIMLSIVSQREEVEEAKKMDEARLRSEHMQQEQAQKQKAAQEESMQQATSIPELRKVFKKSWLLSSLDSKTTKKQKEQELVHLKQLLQLEQKAQCWYGDSLPFYYFEKLKTRMKTWSAKGRLEMIKQECKILKRVLFELQEQQGGVPKVFLKAQQEGKANNHNNANNNSCNQDDDDDDEIVVLGSSPAVSKPRRNGAHNNSNNTATMEIIEIDD